MVRILFVDDEQNVRDFFIELFGDDYDVLTASSGKQALTIIGEKSPDIVVLDIIMPEMDGIETLKSIRIQYPDQMVIMLTAVNNVQTAVQTMKLGVFDYITKPFELNEIRATLNKAIEHLNLQNEVKFLRNEYSKLYSTDKLIGVSPAIREVFDMIDKVADKDVTVLINGETGTGKELVARAIHNNSKRTKNTFVSIDCSSIPETLIESELFGHEKGAFTGAVDKKIGRFEVAHNGTLFLDEIGNLSPNIQIKLLRALQEQEINRLGNQRPIKVNVRLISATHIDLETSIAQGNFREDLFYRLNVIRIKMPPLRDRKEDIPLLIDYFLKKLSKKFGDKKKKLSSESLENMENYNWPGNIRELQNIIERAVVLSGNNEVITEDYLNINIADKKNRGFDFPIDISFKEAQAKFEKHFLRKVLQSCNGSRKEAADILKLERSYISKLVSKYNIEV